MDTLRLFRNYTVHCQAVQSFKYLVLFSIYKTRITTHEFSAAKAIFTFPNYKVSQNTVYLCFFNQNYVSYPSKGESIKFKPNKLLVANDTNINRHV